MARSNHGLQQGTQVRWSLVDFECSQIIANFRGKSIAEKLPLRVRGLQRQSTRMDDVGQMAGAHGLRG